jgi:hypothetical protein
MSFSAMGSFGRKRDRADLFRGFADDIDFKGKSPFRQAASKDMDKFFEYTGKEVTNWASETGNCLSSATNGKKLSCRLHPGEGYLSTFNQAGTDHGIARTAGAQPGE